MVEENAGEGPDGILEELSKQECYSAMGVELSFVFIILVLLIVRLLLGGSCLLSLSLLGLLGFGLVAFILCFFSFGGFRFLGCSEASVLDWHHTIESGGSGSRSGDSFSDCALMRAYMVVISA